MNAVRIFNEKEVDELIFLDIEATPSGVGPDIRMLQSVASECFMPLCYGGGISSLQQVEKVLKVGVEKVALNTALVERPDIIREAARNFGSSTIVAAVDYKKTWLNRTIAVTRSGFKKTLYSPVELARKAEDLGAGEILLNSIDQDGMMNGYDLKTIAEVTSAVTVPVIACGGAGSIEDFKLAIQRAHASAVAAGSFFVFVGKHRAVLITYPEREERNRIAS